MKARIIIKRREGKCNFDKCSHNKRNCGVRSCFGWYCTLIEGHSGKHLACSVGNTNIQKHNLQIW